MLKNPHLLKSYVVATYLNGKTILEFSLIKYNDHCFCLGCTGHTDKGVGICHLAIKDIGVISVNCVI